MKHKSRPVPGYRKLPQLAGITTMDEASRPGLGVEECVGRLKRFHYAFKRLYEIFSSRIPAEPIYELKSAFALHAHLCAEHATALRTRVGEMREPPLGLEKVPHEELRTFFDEIQAVPSTEELILGLYEKAVPALIDAMNRHLRETSPLADHPSIRICRFALLELYDMVDFGGRAVECLVDERHNENHVRWLTLLDECLGAAGGLDGAEVDRPRTLRAVHSREAYVLDRVPRRDERFTDPYNGGVNPEAFLYNPKYPVDAKVLMMFYKRLREIDVPEMMATILHDQKDKPWDFRRAMVRQLWDEARHALMGEVGFNALGIDWRKIPINFTWSLNLNTQLSATERHAVLFFIEQGLMTRTGKRYEWEVALSSGNALAGLFQDYDWADEVLHAAIGREWYVSQFASPQEATEYGDRCWSRVMSHWSEVKEKGLTEHRNWWADLYKEYCASRGIEPDPEVLAFNETYETVRADLKKITG